ncbi:MAG: hypothetical protein V7645_3053 [Actinomycetota bacterium]|jgi:integrase
MSVNRRKDGRWRVDVVGWQGGERTRIRKAAKTKEEAIRIEGGLRAKLVTGQTVAPTKVPTFADWAKEFLDVYATTNNKPSEVATKKTLLAHHLVPAFGSARLDRIGVADIEKYKAAKRALGRAPKTVNNHLAVLRRMLHVAIEWGRMPGPAPRVAFLKVTAPDITFLSFEESKALLKAADAEWRPMVLTALRTGLRIGELLALRWDDVDLASARLLVRRNVYRGAFGSPKGGRERQVSLSPETVAALQALPSRSVKGFVFGSGHEVLTPGEVRWPLWRAADGAKLKRFSWHVLRHTFASHLVMRGVPLSGVQGLLGHRSIVMTERYAHLTPEVSTDAVRRLDEPAPLGAAPEGRGPIGARF